MARKTRLGATGIMENHGFPVTRRQVLDSYLGETPRIPKTPENFARKILAMNIQTVRYQKELSPKKSQLENAILKLFSDDRIKKIILDSQVKKLGAGLTSVSKMLVSSYELMAVLHYVRKNNGFQSYNQAAESIMKNPRTRNEFAKSLSVFTNTGAAIERPGHKEMIYTLLAGRKNPVIIDVGMSEGVSTSALARFLAQKKLGARIIGTDIFTQKEAIERSRKYGFKFTEKDIIESPVLREGQQKADFIRASRVLQYMTKDSQLLSIKNMLADLKIGGYLYIPDHLYRKVSESRVERIQLESAVKDLHL